jgi:hypothetical protein
MSENAKGIPAKSESPKVQVSRDSLKSGASTLGKR